MIVKKVTYVEDEFTYDEKCKFIELGVITHTTYGTFEINGEDLVYFNNIIEKRVEPDKYDDREYNKEYKEILIERIGSDVYDALLEGFVDIVTIVAIQWY